MVIVWQYGSNMDEERINSSNRLKGAAKFVGLAIKNGFRLAFTHTNVHGVGVSDIVESAQDDYIIGCLYEIPDTKMQEMDKFEGVNSGAYKRIELSVKEFDKESRESGKVLTVTTYTVVRKEENPRTDIDYANHILKGIRDHKMGATYFDNVRKVIIKNNPEIQKELIVYS